MVRAYHQGDATTVLGADGIARRFAGASAVLVRELLEFFIEPRSRMELLAHLARRSHLANPEEVPAKAVDDLLSLLTGAHVLVEKRDAPVRSVPPGARIVLGITGAVAAAETPLLTRLLIAREHDLRIAMSRAARRFVRPEALEALGHHKVYRSLWDRDTECLVPHIHLAKWAEAVLIYPASATTLSRIARGDCSDLVAAVALATAAPVVLAPSMNGQMLAHPVVRRNLDQLRSDGFMLLEPALGTAAARTPESSSPRIGSAPPPQTAIELLEIILHERRSTESPLAGREDGRNGMQ